MLLDVGLVFEQHQWLHDEALDELGGRVRTQRQDLLVGEQVSGSLHVTQPLSPRVLERTRTKQFAWDGMMFEIHRRGVQASSSSDRRRASRSRSGSRRPRGAMFWMLVVIVLDPSCPCRGTPNEHGENPTIRSGRGDRGAGVTPLGRPDHPRGQRPGGPPPRVWQARVARSVAPGLASLRRAFWPLGPARR